VAELEAAGALIRRVDAAYEIGPQLWHLGLLAQHAGLREAALPLLQDVVVKTGHTVHLAVLEETEALCVERLNGSQTVSPRHGPGGRLPLHCTAVGKVILAFTQDDGAPAGDAELARYTPFTVTDRRQLARQVADIRRTGVAFSEQERRMGVWSVAVPVRTADGVVAALGVLAAMGTPRLQSTVGPLLGAAAGIAARIGSVDEGSSRRVMSRAAAR
jgi:DNA-binding IclR family transcriptional regulator